MSASASFPRDRQSQAWPSPSFSAVRMSFGRAIRAAVHVAEAATAIIFSC